MTSRFHVNPPTMPRKGSSNISAQGLLKLLESKGKSGFLRRRRISSIRKTVKWKHQFVILSHSALYIYENEMSKSPEMAIPLLGYIAVERETTTTCAWVFALVPGISSLPRKSFACAKDEERREWMQEIKQHLYTANNIKDIPTTSKFTEKMGLAEHLTDEERMYVELEFPIIPPEDKKTGDDNDDDDDDEDPLSAIEDEEEDEDNLGVSGKGLLPNPRRPSIKTTKGQGQIQDEAQGLQNDMPDGIMPPRYSAIVGGVELEYENIGSVAGIAKEVGLEKACTIKDENLSRDRDACVTMLKKTKKAGTYLIRRSRTKDYKVLSVLADENTIKEYRIEEAYGLFHFFHDPSHEFPTIQSLLAYYSHHKPVPALDRFLGWGIHECVEEGGQTYEETC